MDLVSSPPIRADWLVELARPYLRGYKGCPETSEELWGYLFKRSKGGTEIGFFAGFLLSADNHVYLSVAPPACLVFAFIHPVNAPLHRRLVAARESLFRRTASYISWLTARRPYWRFLENKVPALYRGESMKEWPRRRREHFARNFFTESFALLVRSGLVRELSLLSGRKSASQEARPSRLAR